MSRITTLAPLASLAAALLALAPLPAAAQARPAASSPVDVLGQRIAADPPRRDASKVCPALHAELPEALAGAWQRVGQSAVVRLRFTLEGSRVRDAVALDGPRAYHRHLRWALHDVSCASDRPGPQQFEIAVRFVDPQELAASGGRRVAVLAD